MAPLQDETVLLDPRTNQFCLLNSTAALLWDRLQDLRTPEQLVDELCRSFDEVDRVAAARDVKCALEQLLSLDLIAAESAMCEAAGSLAQGE